MKKWIIFPLILFYILQLINFASAIRINEVEINPIEGNEWVELYNNGEEINISGWEVWEGVYGLSGPKKILTIAKGTILQKGEYFIVEFYNKLNNDGDYVLLKDFLGNEIDKTDTFKETSRSEKTWQFCNDEWVFSESTKGNKNNCKEPQEENEPENQNQEDEEEEIIEKEITKEEFQEEIKSSPKNNSVSAQVIKLNENPKDIKSENSKELNKSRLAVYGIITFCFILIALFLLRKERYKKNEFR